MENYIRAFFTIVRILIPILSVILVFCCANGLLSKRKRGYNVVLLTDDMKESQLSDGEYIIGSDEDCDVVMDKTEDKHLVISVSGKNFSLRPLFKNKVGINRHSVREETAFLPDDLLSANDREFSLIIKKHRGKSLFDGRLYKAASLCCLTLIQFFVTLSLCFSFSEKIIFTSAVFLALIFGEWIYFAVTRFKGAFVEIPVLFLVTLGLSVAAHRGTSALIKQFICLILGIIGSLILSKIIVSSKRAIKLRFVAFILGGILFGANLFFGVIYNGAQNWLNIGGFSFQPSEFIKVALIFMSGASVEKLSSIKDISLFAVFSVFCLGSLFYLSDFGTALIYAVVFFTVIAIRLCSVKLIAVLSALAVLCGGAVIILFPYVAKRIFSFGKAFENAYDSGYQQTRAMIATASGGLFGVGGGKGTLINVAASDTDIVFGLISEEFGLIVSLCALAVFIVFVLYSIRVLTNSKSTYYSVTACATAVLLLTQTALNVFGTLDMLPFTGVTLPFISNGGSSLLSCLALTAFLRTPLIQSNGGKEQ